MYFKALMNGRVPPMISAPPWPKVGIWTEKKKPILCHSGWHMVSAKDLSGWLCYPSLWLAEGRGGRDVGSNKTSFEQARLVRQLDTGSKMKKKVVERLKKECKENKITFSDYFSGKLYQRDNFSDMYSTLVCWIGRLESPERNVALSTLSFLFFLWGIEVEGVNKKEKVSW